MSNISLPIDLCALSTKSNIALAPKVTDTEDTLGRSDSMQTNEKSALESWKVVGKSLSREIFVQLCEQRQQQKPKKRCLVQNGRRVTIYSEFALCMESSSSDKNNLKNSEFSSFEASKHVDHAIRLNSLRLSRSPLIGQTSRSNATATESYCVTLRTEHELVFVERHQHESTEPMWKENFFVAAWFSQSASSVVLSYSVNHTK